MKRITLLAATLSTYLVASSAWAVPTVTLFIETPPCDLLIGPQISDELGFMPPFPPDEALAAVSTFIQEPACLSAIDDPAIPNAVVMMTNLTMPPRAFRDVWYVKDRETSFSNVDGMVNGEDAFRIDAVGINTPLIAESMAVDGVWMPGETWTFVIQDYMNALGLPPSLYDSIGVPSTLSPPSSGSIIVIPEPSAAVLAAIGVLLLAFRLR